MTKEKLGISSHHLHNRFLQPWSQGNHPRFLFSHVSKLSTQFSWRQSHHVSHTQSLSHLSATLRGSRQFDCTSQWSQSLPPPPSHYSLNLLEPEVWDGGITTYMKEVNSFYCCSDSLGISEKLDIQNCKLIKFTWKTFFCCYNGIVWVMRIPIWDTFHIVSVHRSDGGISRSRKFHFKGMGSRYSYIFLGFWLILQNIVFIFILYNIFPFSPFMFMCRNVHVWLQRPAYLIHTDRDIGY